MPEITRDLTYLEDQILVEMLDLDHPWRELLSLYEKKDFLIIDEEIEVPFFAQTRDYVGAYNKFNEHDTWLLKPIVSEEELMEFSLAMYSYFINFITGNLSAPTIIADVKGKKYRATKVMKRTEQLSGAPYLENKNMRDQLILDCLNSWVFYDQDRNPNNYLVFYTKRNYPAIIAIDFSMGDLLSKERQVKGLEETFGWTRTGKNRYLTPLKTELFYTYSMDFFNERFDQLKGLTRPTLKKIGNSIFRKHDEKQELVTLIVENMKDRIDYVYKYFKSWFGNPKKLQQLVGRTFDDMKDEYSIMGKSFNTLHSDFENK